MTTSDTGETPQTEIPHRREDEEERSSKSPGRRYSSPDTPGLTRNRSTLSGRLRSEVVIPHVLMTEGLNVRNRCRNSDISTLNQEIVGGGDSTED